MGTNSAFSNVGVRIMVGALVTFVVLSFLFIGLALLPPTPNLPPVSSSDEWYALRDEQREILSTYGWIDQEAGVVRIPIDRAIDLSLERGLPARESAAETQSSN